MLFDLLDEVPFLDKFDVDHWPGLLRAVVVVMSALVLRWIFHRRVTGNQTLAPQQAMLIKRAATVVIFFVAVLLTLDEMEVDFAPLLGAAGLVTVAVGFAGQTAVSNMLSGFFLMGEKPFVIGDLIRVGDMTGEVLTIELMSVRIRTLDNKLVRIPNETVLKANLINLTKFPIRRVDFSLSVSYDEDPDAVRKVLMHVAEENPFALNEPEPLFMMTGFGENGLDIQFAVWATTDHYVEVKTRMLIEIKRAFDREGIEIPYPHRVVEVVEMGNATSAHVAGA